MNSKSFLQDAPTIVLPPRDLNESVLHPIASTSYLLKAWVVGISALVCTTATLCAEGVPATNVRVNVVVDHNLLPGAGPVGSTSQPASIGTAGSVGYDAKTIARWDVVPFQTFSTDFRAGVVAFHREGIDRVEFSANGGPWIKVVNPQLNPQTGVVEYYAQLLAADFPDGQIQLRAIAYPNVGIPRVLDPLIISANSRGTLSSPVRYVSSNGSDTNNGLTQSSAFATISHARNSIAASFGSVNGAIIKLGAGSYILGNLSEPWTYTAPTRWLTIEPAAGVDPSLVTITGCQTVEGIRTEKVRLNNLRVTGSIKSAGVGGDHLWFSNVAVVGSALTADLTPGAWDNTYITDSTVTTTRRGVAEYTLARKVAVSMTGESGFVNTGVVINCSVSRTVRGSPEFHPDVYQFTVEQPNSILYNFTATDSIDDTFGIRIQPSARDIAIVNVSIKMGQRTVWLWEMERPYSNILVQNCILDGGLVYTGTLSAVNIVFDRCTFPRGVPAGFPGITFR